MGAVQAVPIVAEFVSVVESGGKTIAAGACALTGKSKAAKELLEGASQTWKNYVEVNVIAANINMAGAYVTGNHDKVNHLKERQGQAWVDVAENTPAIGHAIGVARYLSGDSEGGNQCMFGATRAGAVVAATTCTGGLGPLFAGAAAASSGVLYDSTVSLVNLAAGKKNPLVGFVKGVKHAVDSKNANAIFDAVAMLVADAAAGALHGALRILERSTPAAELAGASRGRRPSPVGTYKRYSEVPGTSRQVPLAVLRENPSTVGFVKEFQSPADFMCQLERKQGYDFARLQDGSMRAIKHSDRDNVGRLLGDSSLRAGHTSIVEPDTSVVAAGELYVNAAGIIESINNRSGHFQVKLQDTRNLMGRVLHRPVPTFAPRTFDPLLIIRVTHTAIYTPALIAGILNNNSVLTPLLSSLWVLAFYEDGEVRMVVFPGMDINESKEAYDKVPSTVMAKVLIYKPGDTMESSHGITQCVNMCIEKVSKINAVFPLGNWQQNSKDIETWFDPTSGRYQMRCACRNHAGEWELNEVDFMPDSHMKNEDGKLVNAV